MSIKSRKTRVRGIAFALHSRSGFVMPMGERSNFEPEDLYKIFEFIDVKIFFFSEVCYLYRITIS